MHNEHTISLLAKDILSYTALNSQINRKKEFDKIKSLTENACIPLHLCDRKSRSIDIKSSYSASRAPNSLRLAPSVVSQAMKIVSEENQKLKEQGINKEWIDGEKLAVQDITVLSDNIIIGVSIIKWSQILSMKKYVFEEIADVRAFKLDTNSHVIAKENGKPILLVGQRGRKPGDPRMGSEALLAPKDGKVQWTLASNGTVDLDVMLMQENSKEIWKHNSMKELSEELGVSGAFRISYLGLMVDPVMFVGALGVVGIIETDLNPYQVDEARKKAKHSIEVPVLDVIPVEKEKIAQYLRVNRCSMVPQLVSGLVMLGYNIWGADFLKEADK